LVAGDQLCQLSHVCVSVKELGPSDASKRQAGKSAATLVLGSRIGEQFGANVAEASDEGTLARLLTILVEGKVVRGFEGVDVGDRICVQLISINVERGFIDFKGVGPAV
jgi:hypothetical protein